VLEAVPSELAKAITSDLDISTIGIGAGPDCDGQVLVLQDMLGIYPRPSPKFSKNFMQGAASVADAVKAYITDVKSGKFPGPEHSFHSA
jgi:3-methyl-2-oxobutanoate hydroxymethyltransferase